MGSQNGVPKGASHGIGHVLGGTADVPHGYTSCVMLPHVLRFNAAGQRRAPGAGSARRWAGRAKRPRDAVAELIAGLGLPARCAMSA